MMKNSHPLPKESDKSLYLRAKIQKISLRRKAVVLLRLAGRKGYLPAYLSYWHVLFRWPTLVGHWWGLENLKISQSWFCLIFLNLNLVKFGEVSELVLLVKFGEPDLHT